MTLSGFDEEEYANQPAAWEGEVEAEVMLADARPTNELGPIAEGERAGNGDQDIPLKYNLFYYFRGVVFEERTFPFEDL